MCSPVSGSHNRYRGAMITDFILAACPEMIFTELPITERVQRIDDLGFQVEIWDLDQTRHRLKAWGPTTANLRWNGSVPRSLLGVSRPTTYN
jgi:hypothetical protein